jgi:hypothetical protein
MNWFTHFDYLAPGDLNAQELVTEGVEVVSIHSIDHPYFERAFQGLWNEFGEKAEVESREILQKRLTWQGNPKADHQRYFYQLLWIHKEGVPMGVRDHTVIFNPSHQRVTVHLSHNLIFPDFRRSGLARWMRAWPLVFAHECMKRWGVDRPVTLVAEMEPIIDNAPDRLPRLISVEKAGFLKVSGGGYYQPDFRSFDQIDLDGGAKPLPMSLILRRVGNEEERVISGQELHEVVSSLYGMYGEGFRKKDMDVALKMCTKITPHDPYELIPPSSPS